MKAPGRIKDSGLILLRFYQRYNYYEIVTQNYKRIYIKIIVNYYKINDCLLTNIIF